jgi:hypothetical protein
MRLHKSSLPLATIIAALAGASTFDGASAQTPRGQQQVLGSGYVDYRASRESRRLPRASSQQGNFMMGKGGTRNITRFSEDFDDWDDVLDEDEDEELRARTGRGMRGRR